MQLVAGLQLGPDEMERREMPPHMIRSRHGPRYDNTTPWERRRATVKQHVSTGNDNHFTSIHVRFTDPKLYNLPQSQRYLSTTRTVSILSTANTILYTVTIVDS
ncbi:hypothetical protein RR46_00742 [Papilio xuthus]|uniref:Uncharacterized protein n=1 Tax=Papilio xuthus TaxID=66420 RepID=A0A0N0PAG0_PAPXU|nr:hypothetical protein RR46_00742 [Papilio xuthus]